MKYAAAISPESTKATGRVNRPSSNSAPPTNSRMPAKPNRDINGTWPMPSIAGTPNNFSVPCWMKRKATTMRRMPSTFGAQEGGFPKPSMISRVELPMLAVSQVSGCAVSPSLRGKAAVSWSSSAVSDSLAPAGKAGAARRDWMRCTVCARRSGWIGFKR